MFHVKLLLIFSLFGVISTWRIFHKGRARHGNLGVPPTNVSDLPKEQYFDQLLDHFDPSNTQTWKQRYFINNKFYKASGPIFLLISGESEANSKWMVEGTWIDYAKKFNAFCVMIEHRFYGKSRPTEDLRVKNLSYLSSDQALADIAYFINYVNVKHGMTFSSKWIVMGGSYAGSLAAWMRLKYPHLVHGAISTSGPLVALPDFKDYFGVVRESLASYSLDCVTAIETGTEQLSSLLGHPLGQQSVTKLFRLCDELIFSNEDDVSNLHESLASNFAGVVQYNKDNRHDKSHLNDVTIDTVCDIMNLVSIGKEINRLAAVNSLLLQKTNESCLDYKYSKMISQLRNTSWDSEAAEGSRQWTYQTCTEFGFFQTSALNTTKKMFGDRFPVEFFEKQCLDIFGFKFSEAFVKSRTQMTNTMFGGMNVPVDNIVYVHGSIDPWHALGITTTLREGSPAIYIKGTAHCANMYPSSPKDSPELVAARKKIEDYIASWFNQ